jgi:mannose-1-phosphate guanylyltransferase
MRPWVLVLAGGDGIRLRGAWIEARRLDRPKQFCRLRGERSLLQETLVRAERVTSRDRIVAMVREEHRHWWVQDLRSWSGIQVIAQATNRGTAVAILQGLGHALRHDEQPLIVIMPSDHGVVDGAALHDATERAAACAREDTESTFLLGMRPERVEDGYGWIVPELGDGGVQRVSRFIEKPPRTRAIELRASGALVNSMIGAASARGLQRLLQAAHPSLAHPERSSRDLLDHARLRSLPVVDFSRDVLERSARRLRVVPVRGCGWTDLGTPERVSAWLRSAAAHETEFPDLAIPEVPDLARIPELAGALAEQDAARGRARA